MSGNPPPPQSGGRCANLPWERILRVLGALLGVLVIILGFVSIFTSSFNPKNLVNSIYRVLFGALIILAELRMYKWLKFFSFLTSYFGLGAFYIFVGGLALGGEWYEWVLAIFFLAIGVVYINAGCCAGKKMYEGNPDAIPAGAVQQGQSKAVPAAAVAQSQQQPHRSSQQEMVQFEDDPQAESAWPNDRV